MNQEYSPSQLSVLLVDDDKKLCGLMADYLEPMGYRCQAVYNGKQALETIKNSTIHAVILDVMMPEMDGFEVLRQLRTFSDVPVLMLTALGDETDRIVGLELGADDYLPKTFSTRELLARLRAVTRRYFKAKETFKPKSEKNCLQFDQLEINIDAREVFLHDRNLDLTPFEYELLLCLAKSRGKVLTRDLILERVAEREHDVFDRSIDVHISALRKKLQDNPRQPKYIQTVRAAGYMFVAKEGDER